MSIASISGKKPQKNPRRAALLERRQKNLRRNARNGCLDQGDRRKEEEKKPTIIILYER